jgi:hypothetical protein
MIMRVMVINKRLFSFHRLSFTVFSTYNWPFHRQAGDPK